ncbi:MAG: GAF domain-containing protein, partial [Flammeovirgaceae bacterium]
QTFLEGSKTLLRDVPSDYISITSGLGEATPRCIVISPLVFNGYGVGVIELATFKTVEPHEMEFVDRACEIVATEISRAKMTQEIGKLLDISRKKEEELRLKGEELKQNMEELTAAQEDMLRKEQRYLKQIEALKGL